MGKGDKKSKKGKISRGSSGVRRQKKSNQTQVEVISSKKTSKKKEVKEAIELMFKVEVTAVNILNMNGKTKRAGKLMGKRNDWKKAYISIKTGQEINFTGE